MFVESLESLSENHNVSFNVDSGLYLSLEILNLRKSNLRLIEVYNTFKISTVRTASLFNRPVLFIPAHS